MSHTLRYKDEDDFEREANPYLFHVNGDYSGKVTITRWDENNDVSLEKFTIPMNVLLQFVSSYIRDGWVERVEGLSWRDLIGFVEGRK